MEKVQECWRLLAAVSVVFFLLTPHPYDLYRWVKRMAKRIVRICSYCWESASTKWGSILTIDWLLLG